MLLSNVEGPQVEFEPSPSNPKLKKIGIGMILVILAMGILLTTQATSQQNPLDRKLDTRKRHGHKASTQFAAMQSMDRILPAQTFFAAFGPNPSGAKDYLSRVGLNVDEFRTEAERFFQTDFGIADLTQISAGAHGVKTIPSSNGTPVGTSFITGDGGSLIGYSVLQTNQKFKLKTSHVLHDMSVVVAATSRIALGGTRGGGLFLEPGERLVFGYYTIGELCSKSIQMKFMSELPLRGPDANSFRTFAVDLIWMGPAARFPKGTRGKALGVSIAVPVNSTHWNVKVRGVMTFPGDLE